MICRSDSKKNRRFTVGTLFAFLFMRKKGKICSLSSNREQLFGLSVLQKGRLQRNLLDEDQLSTVH